MNTPIAAKRTTGQARPMELLGETSPIGIGSFAGEASDADDVAYESAVTRAMERGITLVDTSINYRCQRSERAIGRALRGWKRFSTATAGPAHVTVCTKGGYIPLESPAPASKAAYREYVEREYFDSWIIERDDLVADGHCIAPRFVSDQVTRSRANLGVAAIDLYYLHNPEQQLDAISRELFAGRLRKAFEALEGCVTASAIRAYGCATWHGLRVPPEAPNHLSLEMLVQTARDVAGDRHHFSAVQLPINLGMPEAIRATNQEVGGTRCTLLQAAADLGVAVIACAPLLHGQLAGGLPDALRSALPDAPTDAGRALNFVRSLPGVTSTIVGMRSVSHVDENADLFA